MRKKLIIYWTYTRWTDSHTESSLIAHQTRQGKHNDDQRTGGLGFDKPLFTRIVRKDGRLITILPEKDVIHLAVEGGLDPDFKYKDTTKLSIAQALAFRNEIKSIVQSFPNIEIMSEDFRNFDVQLWLKVMGLR